MDKKLFFRFSSLLNTFVPLPHYIYVFFGFSHIKGSNLSSIERLNVTECQKFEIIYVNEQITLSSLACAKLEGLSPLAVLARGYSVTESEGHVVTSVDDVAWGSELVTRIGDGKIISIVQETERQEENGN